MTFAHVYDGRIVATYQDGQQPQSYKGKLLPCVETKRPPEKAGSTWSKHWEVFEDRVEVRWADVPLSAEEQDAVETLAETSRIRLVFSSSVELLWPSLAGATPMDMVRGLLIRTVCSWKMDTLPQTTPHGEHL